MCRYIIQMCKDVMFYNKATSEFENGYTNHVHHTITSHCSGNIAWLLVGSLIRLCKMLYTRIYNIYSTFYNIGISKVPSVHNCVALCLYIFKAVAIMEVREIYIPGADPDPGNFEWGIVDHVQGGGAEAEVLDTLFTSRAHIARHRPCIMCVENCPRQPINYPPSLTTSCG